MSSPSDTLRKVAYDSLGRILSFAHDPKGTAKRTAEDARKLPLAVATQTLGLVYKLRTRNDPPARPAAPRPTQVNDPVRSSSAKPPAKKAAAKSAPVKKAVAKKPAAKKAPAKKSPGTTTRP